MEETKRKAPQNLGHILLPAGFFQVVLLIPSSLYLLFLFIGKPYCSFSLILAMANTQRQRCKTIPDIWEKLPNSWR
jgi:Na+/H+ antiporter NhaC